MALVKHFKELRVYQHAFAAATRIYRLSKRWPAEERYSLTDQIRRSSRSVCANIAEAWRKRRYPAHFVSKLSDSDSEAAETQVWLDFALDGRCLSRARRATALRPRQSLREAVFDCLSWKCKMFRSCF